MEFKIFKGYSTFTVFHLKTVFIYRIYLPVFSAYLKRCCKSRLKIQIFIFKSIQYARRTLKLDSIVYRTGLHLHPLIPI